MVLVREPWSQQADRREADRSLRETIQDHRKPPRRTRGLNAVVGLVLRQVQDFVAIREQGRRAFLQVEIPHVELDEVCDEARRYAALGLRELADRRDQLGIGQLGWNHSAHGRALWKDGLPDLVR